MYSTVSNFIKCLNNLHPQALSIELFKNQQLFLKDCLTSLQSFNITDIYNIDQQTDVTICVNKIVHYDNSCIPILYYNISTKSVLEKYTFTELWYTYYIISNNQYIYLSIAENVDVFYLFFYDTVVKLTKTYFNEHLNFLDISNIEVIRQFKDIKLLKNFIEDVSIIWRLLNV